MIVTIWNFLLVQMNLSEWVCHSDLFLFVNDLVNNSIRNYFTWGSTVDKVIYGACWWYTKPTIWPCGWECEKVNGSWVASTASGCRRLFFFLYVCTSHTNSGRLISTNRNFILKYQFREKVQFSTKKLGYRGRE